MKKFFSVAALVGFAAAGYGTQKNPYLNGSYGGGTTPDPDPDPVDPRGKECSDKVEELETQLKDIENSCEDQTEDTAGIEGQCTTIGISVSSITSITEDHSADIAYRIEKNR